MAAFMQGMPHAGMSHGQAIGPGHAPNTGQPMAHPMHMHPGAGGPGAQHVGQAGGMMVGMPPGGPGNPGVHALQHLPAQSQQAMMQQQQQQQQQQQHQQQQQQQQQFNMHQMQAMAASQAQNPNQFMQIQQQKMLAQLRQQQQLQGASQNNMQLAMPAGNINPAQMAALQQAQNAQLAGNGAIPQHLQGPQYAALQQQQLARQQQQQQQLAAQQAQQQQQQQQQAQQLAAAQQQQQQQQQAQQAQQQQAQQQQAQQQAQQQQAQQQAQVQQQAQQQAQVQQQVQQQAQQQAQQHAQQQAQQQAQQHAQQQAQQHAVQQAQQLTMQHAPSQSSNQGQHTPQPQQGQQAPQQQQMRQVSTAPSHEAQNSPAQVAGAQQGNTPNAQAASGMQPGSAGQPQSSQAAQQQGVNVNQHQAALRQQHQNQQQLQKAFLQSQHALMARNQMQRQGHAIFKLYQFSDHISRYRASERSDDEQFWRKFVDEFFTVDGSMRQTFKDNSDKSSKQFEVHFSSLPRYFFVHYDAIEQVQITIESPVEKAVGNLKFVVEAQVAKFIYWFKNGTQLVCLGRIQAICEEDKFSMLFLETVDYQQYVSRSQVENVFSRATVKSPRMTKKLQNQRAQVKSEGSVTLKDIPEVPKTSYGVPHSVQHFLEMNETFSLMTDAMKHYQENPQKRPYDCMLAVFEGFTQVQQVHNAQQQIQQNMQLAANGNNVHMMQQQQQQQQHQQQAQQQQQQQGSGPVGMRTPGQMHMQAGIGMHQGLMMASPAMQAGMLPNGMTMGGSPHMSVQGGIAGQHMSSPAQGHMQAPAMVQQMSHQGSTGSGAEVNTSPNVAGAAKRRRQSTVKAEDEGGGPGDVNGVGAKVKQSPRVGGNKRLKNG